MTFLHVAMLGGAALVAVPIVLHLIMRQQPRIAEFPALRFIKLREQSNRRRLQLRHLLLLLLRCAVILLLALALARPSMKASGILADQEAPAAVAMVIDNSPRMDYRHQNKTRLDQAKETALWLLPQLPAESDVAVLDGQTRDAVFGIDPAAARRRIARLTTAASGQPLAALLEEGLRLVTESERRRKEVYVLTDLTRPGWSEDAVRSLRTRLASSTDTAIYLIDVGVPTPINFGLVRSPAATSQASTGSAVRVGAELRHAGPAATRTVELYLATASGKFEKRSQQVVALGQGESKGVNFELGLLPAGVQQGYLKLAEEDALARDDTCPFTVEVQPPAKVLIGAAGDPARQAFFLSEALAPRELRLKGEAFFDCQVLAIDKLPALLPSARAVCLVDPPPLAAGIWRQFENYVAAGGGLAIFLGRQARVAEFNQPAAQHLLPAKLLRQRKAASGAFFLDPRNLQHPIFAKLRSRESAIPWDGMPVFTHWQLGELNKGAHLVIPFSNRLPALVESALGRGRIFTLTTSVSDPPSRRDTWNLLLTGEESWPGFVLVNEMMFYLSGGREKRLNYFAGDTAVIPVAEAQRDATFVLTTPTGERLRQPADQKQAALVISGTDTPGNYRAEEGGKQAALGFSVALSADASDLMRMRPEDLKNVFGSTPFRLARNREEIDRSVSVARLGRELYPYLVVLLALILAAEQLLANRFYRHETPPAAAAGSSMLNGMRDPLPPPLPVESVTASVS